MDTTNTKTQKAKLEIVWPAKPYTFSELKALNPNAVPITLRFANLSQGAKRGLKKVGTLPSVAKKPGRREEVYYTGEVNDQVVLDYAKDTGAILFDTAISVVPVHVVQKARKKEKEMLVATVSATTPEQSIDSSVPATPLVQEDAKPVTV